LGIQGSREGEVAAFGKGLSKRSAKGVVESCCILDKQKNPPAGRRAAMFTLVNRRKWRSRSDAAGAVAPRRFPLVYTDRTTACNCHGPLLVRGANGCQGNSCCQEMLK